MIKLSTFPTQTSYFSIQTFLSTKTINETAIALDIIKQYYDNRDLAGENTRTLTIEGYGDFISFDELCLGIWMVFDRLYWGFPQEVQESVGLSRIGWNGEVTNPSVDIAMVLKMFDELSAPASNYHDKMKRLETIEKWFYKEGTKFIDYESYEELKKLNEQFYNWIESRLSAIEELINSSNVTTIEKVSRDYIFDLKPSPKYYDTDYTPSDAELGLLNEALIAGNKFYLSFLTVLEQVLYSFTRRIFPLKLYATFSYLYKEYLKIIVNFVKPYHAYNLDLDPIFKIEGDINENVLVGDVFQSKIIKQLVSSVVYKLFDDDKDDGSAYDSIDQIREYIKNNITLSSIMDNMYYSFRFDNPSNLLLFDNNEYVFTEELRIFKNTIHEKEYTGGFPSLWRFYIPKMNKPRSTYIYKLTWDHTNKTLTNNWDRDVVLIGREKFFVGTNCDMVEIEAIADPNVRFALNFDFIQRPPRHEFKDVNGISNCWCYNETNGWFRKQLDYKYNYYSQNFYARELLPNDVIDTTGLMTIQDLESITSFPYNIRWLRPVIVVPVGSSFTNIKIRVKSLKKEYPYKNTISLF